MRKLRMIVKRPDEPYGHVCHVSDRLENLQKTVEGYIEVLPISDTTVIICNEEGKIKGLPHNMYFGPHDLVGTIMVVDVDGEEFSDLSLELKDWKDIVNANNRKEGEA